MICAVVVHATTNYPHPHPHHTYVCRLKMAFILVLRQERGSQTYATITS
jgi:hypothetical protein